MKLQVKLIKLSVIAVLILSVCTALAAAPIEIISPKFVNPEFAEPGDQFLVEVRNTDTTGTFTATVSNDIKTWNCSIVAATRGSINNDRETGWLVSVQLPADVSPELMKLTMTHSLGDSDTAFGAVSVVQDLESDFYIMHTTDEQFSEYENPPDGEASVQSVKWMGPVANLINPRFIAITGDQVEDGNLYDFDYKYGWYKEAKEYFYTVPSLIVIGNNDTQGNEYEELQGQRYYTRQLGSSFFVYTNDFNTDDLLDWVEDEYNDNYNSSDFQLILQHFNNGDAFLPSSSRPCDLMLVGHEHQNAVKQSSPYYILETVTASKINQGKYAKSSVFYIKKNSSNNWTIDTSLSNPASQASGGNQVQPFVDNGVGNLTVTYANTNNGSQTSNTATVKNKLNKNFYDGRVRFLMSGTGPFTVAGDGATLLDDYTYDGGTKTAILVKVDILPGSSSSPSTRTISINGGGTIPPSGTFEKRVSASSDDAEETTSSGSMSLTSSDLELVTDSSAQRVGVRFTEVTIPQGANITNAYIQFTTDETSSGTVTIAIKGEKTANSSTFTSATGNLSNRNRTDAVVVWSPADWNTVGESGVDQRTNDISDIIQEIVDQSEWNSGNALTIIFSHEGKRVAESYDGSSSQAPLLHVEYEE